MTRPFRLGLTLLCWTALPALAAVESGTPAVVSTPAPATSTTLSGPLAKLEPALEPVQRALEQGRLGPAREQVERWLAGRPDSPVVGGAQYLRGRIAQRQGDTATARRAFDEAVRLLPELREVVQAERARAAVRDGNYDDAEALLEGLPEESRAFVPVALEVLDRALRTGSAGEVATLLPRVARGAFKGFDRARLARIEAAVAFSITGDRAAHLDRLAHVWRHWPSSDAARQVEPALLSATTDANANPRSPLTLDDLVGALRKRAGQSPAALAPLRDAARARYGSALEGLDALVEGQAQLDRKPALVLERVVAALPAVTAPEIRDRLLDLQARALRKVERFDEALEVYRIVGRDGAAADRRAHALLEAGRMARRMGRVTEARWFFDRLLARHHDMGAQRAEALFSLGWIAWREGQLEEADSYFARVEAADPRASDTSNRTFTERATYWRARVHQRRGRLDEARAAFQEIERRWPLSYYATLATTWLRVTTEDPKAVFPPPSRLEAPRPPLPEEITEVEPSARGALTLWRIGLAEEARVQLRHRFDQKALGVSGVLLLSALYRDTGNESLAHWVVQGGDPLDVAPEKNAWPRWLSAFPRPFSDLVDREAKARGVDPLLIWSVMRQESGFRTTARSHAKAHGLMQVLLPTAKLVATRFLKERAPTLRTVYTAENNVKYGAAYLRHLLDRFDNHPALAIAGYNAGPGAVDKWLKRFGALDADEFVEEIPYDEARGYTRKVLRSYAAYTRLYAPPGKGPLLVPLELPRRRERVATN